MKFPSFLVAWAAVLFLVCGLVQAADDTLDQTPGSGVTPPNPIVEPLPEPPPAQFRQASIKLGVWIREDGSVEDATVLGGNTAWADASLAAVKRWRFKPVMWQGTALCARTEVSFTQSQPGTITSGVSPLPNLPGELHTADEFGLIKPVLKQEPEIVFPLSVLADGQKIKATLQYVVDEDGKTSRIELIEDSSEEALRVAFDNISACTFQPATIRGKPVSVAYRQTIVFTPTTPPIESLQGAESVVNPSYPYAHLLADEEGSATVRFTLNETGDVVSTELLDASQPDFGSALIAAVESWKFSAVSASVLNVREYRHVFCLANTPYAARRLIAEVRGGKTVPTAAAGLDARPKLLARPPLGYPQALMAKATSGSAEIEFVIDRTGLAQLPRVLNASDPAFGWAAVTCVNGMRFAPLTRGRKPVELRVRFPFKFVPPKPVAGPVSSTK